MSDHVSALVIRRYSAATSQQQTSSDKREDAYHHAGSHARQQSRIVNIRRKGPHKIPVQEVSEGQGGEQYSHSAQDVQNSHVALIFRRAVSHKFLHRACEFCLKLAVMRRRAFLLAWFLHAVVASTAAKAPVSDPAPACQIVHVYPHDSRAFTQGLIFVDGHLYESTGLNGRSSLRMEDLSTGRVLQHYDLPAE